MHRRLLASRLLYSYARTAPARCRSRALSIAAATGSSSWRSISGPSRRPLGLPRQDPRRELHATMSESTALRKIAHELAEDVTTQVEGGLEDTSKVPGYRFPAGKLGKLQSAEKTPLVLIACGSFNPPTFLHLRLFEMTRDWARFNTEYEVVGGFLSPVGDAYSKAGLASASHRTAMCHAAVASSDWIDVDPFEALQEDYQRTVVVLDHFEHEINDVLGGVETPSGIRRPADVALVAGADLIKTMSTPGVWAQEDLDKILSVYGVFIVERAGTDMRKALESIEREGMRWKVHAIQNDVSSTTVRQLLKEDMSVRYVIPQEVIKYIHGHSLYF